MVYTLDELKKRITPVAEKYRLKAVYIFGSYARNEATDDSDVDILVDLEGSIVRGWKMGGVYNDLEECLEKKIDLVTVKTLEDEMTYLRTPKFVDSLNRERMKIYG